MDEPRSGETLIAAMDSMLQVYIPAGEFLMGSGENDVQAEAIEKPQRSISLDSFWIDSIEVTNAMFAAFIEATGYQTEAERTQVSYFYELETSKWLPAKSYDWAHPNGPDSSWQNTPNHPVAHVIWQEAQAYCSWAGRRLPTEAEWEKSARGEDGRFYPWGNTPPSKNLANYNYLYGSSIATGSLPDGSSPYGALDMAGSVWEWVSDCGMLATYTVP